MQEQHTTVPLTPEQLKQARFQTMAKKLDDLIYDKLEKLPLTANETIRYDESSKKEKEKEVKGREIEESFEKYAKTKDSNFKNGGGGKIHSVTFFINKKNGDVVQVGLFNDEDKDSGLISVTFFRVKKQKD